MKRPLRCQRGTSSIEFAIVAPLLILLLIGLIEVGRYTYFAILAAHAARAGAQYAAENLQTAADASVSGPNTKNAALQDAQNLSQWTISSTIICTVSGVVTSCPANNTSTVSPNLVYYVQVQVSGTFNSLMKYPGIPHQVPVTATAIMPVSSQ
jgi:Flp pilus assembly protein TadG